MTIAQLVEEIQPTLALLPMSQRVGFARGYFAVAAKHRPELADQRDEFIRALFLANGTESGWTR